MSQAWVLVIWLWGGGVAAVEFQTEESCKAARIVVMRSMHAPDKSGAVCVPVASWRL